MNILITGAAGFIGFHLARRLLAAGHTVTGLDNLNDYYSVKLKMDRLALLKAEAEPERFSFLKIDLGDKGAIDSLFENRSFSHVVNLAAQAGVRYSLENPLAYIHSNITGFANLLEACRRHRPEHLVFASSSSVYGLNENWPYSTHNPADHPVSLYAATKKSDELLAHSYSQLFHLPATGLRFFTVYGSWGRPDMAMYLFTRNIIEGKPIKVFNNGQLRRDFTHVDDIVEGIARMLAQPATPNPQFDLKNPDPGSSSAPWRIYNIGNSNTIALGDFIGLLEDAIGKKAIREYLPMQPGDMLSTWADVSDLERTTGFAPRTPLAEGIAEYVAWHKEYYGRK